jgi:hypothetical protein
MGRIEDEGFQPVWNGRKYRAARVREPLVRCDLLCVPAAAIGQRGRRFAAELGPSPREMAANLLTVAGPAEGDLHGVDGPCSRSYAKATDTDRLPA